jgi:hypothetical protein
MGIVIFLVLAGVALAVVVPTLPSTTDAVVVVALAVVVIVFVIWLGSQAGGPFLGGWRGRGRMGR